MQTILSINLIVSDPKVRKGQPFIAGTGIGVADLVTAMIFHHRTADELAGDYKLSLSQVYAALSFYYNHKPEVDEVIRQIDARDALLEAGKVGHHSVLP